MGDKIVHHRGLQVADLRGSVLRVLNRKVLSALACIRPKEWHVRRVCYLGHDLKARATSVACCATPQITLFLAAASQTRMEM